MQTTTNSSSLIVMALRRQDGRSTPEALDAGGTIEVFLTLSDEYVLGGRALYGLPAGPFEGNAPSLEAATHVLAEQAGLGGGFKLVRRAVQGPDTRVWWMIMAHSLVDINPRDRRWRDVRIAVQMAKRGEIPDPAAQLALMLLAEKLVEGPIRDWEVLQAD